MSFNVLVISASVHADERFRSDLSSSSQLHVGAGVGHYPAAEELPTLLARVAPEIVLLDCTNFQEALRVSSAIAISNPGMPIIAVNVPGNGDNLLRLLRAGVREVLESPITETPLTAAIANVSRFVQKLSPADMGSLYCFLPAKPGVGASVIALNTCIVLARLSGKRGLLCDLDLNTGISSFFLKLQPVHSIREAIQHAVHLDDDLWNKFTCTRDDVDVIGPGVLGAADLASDSLQRVIAFARRRYSATCVDLSGNFEQWSVELLRQATQVFLVCTQEIPVLHLARIKAESLRELGLGQKVSILLNRAERRQPFTVAEVEKMLGFRVRCTFRNDYKGVNESTLAGEAVSANSDLGRQFETFASSLSAAGRDNTTARPKHRFLEFFSITPTTLDSERKSIS